ncbi:uncharacterized protein LOC141911152 [Tubulanus polymorphus]|uniref:uncharacterized protein LOC141911152 n=1 Tax=Tubulanus polymorphus TaxID=672921 RepID=UPI003DA26B04
MDGSRVEVPPDCVLPHFVLNPPEMANIFRKLPKFNCDTDEKDWVYVRRGFFTIDQSAVRKHGHLTCDYTPVVRGANDYAIASAPTIRNVRNGTAVQADFIEVTCIAADGTKYRNLHLGIAHRPAIKRRPIKLQNNSLSADILMFGFDSVSRMTWTRQLPLTYEYLVKELGSIVLEGYNIVGDGTPQALLPILTGKTEPELPEARRGRSGAKPVDGHPWIWKDLQKLGYVTQHGEDMPNINTFTYRMLGFQEPPTDHYMRPFYLKMDRYKKQRPNCFGSQVRLNLMLKYMRDLYEAYPPNRPKFSFLFNNECSHDDNDPLSGADQLVLDWLKSMHRGGHLDNTFLVIMSDHGARFTKVREFVQGKFEERNPFVSIRPPPWLAEKHPRAVENLRTNSRRLTTPFDLHATFHDLVDFQNRKIGDVAQRGISLLQEIPKNRTCGLARIEPHWCSCLKWKEIHPADPRVIRAANTLVLLINSMTESFRDQCEQLRVTEIARSVTFSPNEQVLKFKKSADTDGRVADLTDDTKNDVVLYQVTLVTKPGDGHFEATIRYSVKRDEFSVNRREISRTNRYGDGPACVMKRYPHLRPYCYCKKF